MSSDSNDPTVSDLRTQASQKFDEGMALSDAILENRADDRVEAATESYETSIQLLSEALELYLQLEDKENEGMTLNALGLSHYRAEHDEEAIAYYRQSVECFSEDKFLGLRITPLNNLGVLYLETGKYDDAQNCYHKILEICQHLSDESREARYLNLLGLVYYQTEKIEDSLVCFYQSSNIYKRLYSLLEAEYEGQANSLSSLRGAQLSQTLKSQYSGAAPDFSETEQLQRVLGSRTRGRGLNRPGHEKPRDDSGLCTCPPCSCGK